MTEGDHIHFGPNPEAIARRRFERLCKASREVSAKFLRSETGKLRRSDWPMTCLLTGRWLEAGEGVMTYSPDLPLELLVCRYMMAMNLVPEEIGLVLSKTVCRLHGSAHPNGLLECLKHEARLIITDAETAKELREPLTWDDVRHEVSAVYSAKTQAPPMTTADDRATRVVAA